MVVASQSSSIMPSHPGEPTWEVAALYPTQGSWTEADYLCLNTNHLVEFTDGVVEFLPMPTVLHQLIVQYLHGLLHAFVAKNATGFVLFAPLPVRVAPGTYREPDIVYCRPERIPKLRSQPEGADLVMEVVSEGAEQRERDLVTKREVYAKAGIGEYWIVDPEERTITVLTLERAKYQVRGVFNEKERADSALLPGFIVDVGAVFSLIQPE
jgi:Uma2 family endonuclease